MQVPITLAASSLSGFTLIAIFASQAAPTIQFGPFFLLICAFGAWFVGNRFAVSLGFFIASIQILNGNASTLDDEPMVSALQLCSVLAVVLMLGVARAALEIEWQYARIDQLTGALNRKAFFETIKDGKAQKGITVLVYADVDRLKQLNDRLGHEAGDEALRDFAVRVRKTIRKNDVFARVGGDEFVIFLSVHDMAAAQIVAQRLNSVLNEEIRVKETQLKCSLGVLVLPAGSKSIDAELKLADKLMYHAKKERIGLMMANSVKGDLQELMPLAPRAMSTCAQKAAIRTAERSIGSAASDGFSREAFGHLKGRSNYTVGRIFIGSFPPQIRR